ncbi:Acetyl-coenzyme A carboxylase carboxyl transferase subunits beta/alpha [Candidatus Protofrankia californiensis]|uniref:Acetyl-coenzyme A carboxylase carboxyl transferase subunit alpha n=1 Tax=Candidatus Protofrankia californiensis TaxID=1839754 RepID=A0A1C3P5Q3_9ACTN|nr:Acetyl-coenzyme A carboxylase carboxyl transferase subunits beta/alpha [Candidatus Protofrankia californiensis]
MPVFDSDPLGFIDSKPYQDRLREARARTGLDEAVRCARGRIDGYPVIVAAMDFRFMGGSLGSVVGEAITRACEVALRERTPLLLVTASGGARMQEGVISLMQMAKTSNALGELDEAGILTLSLITDPTFGGVAASFATLCDIIIAEPAARLGFAGPRVIEQTIKQTLPAGFQTAEFLLAHGIVDMIRPRSELRPTLARLLAVTTPGGRPHGEQPGLPDGHGPEADVPEADVPPYAGRPVDGSLIRDAEALPVRHPWEVVRMARRLGRPTTLDYISFMIDDFNELHGDREAADCPAIVAGLGRLTDIPVAVIGTQKGHTVAELAERRFGMPTPSGYRKAARIMRLAAKIGLPVVTFIDTAGAYPGIEAEEQGQAVAVAENLKLMGGLPVPVVSVITGEGGSGGALALAVSDQVLMCANTVYSVISPEGCAAILWNDPAAAPAAAAALRVDARQLLMLGVIEGVVPEPEGGADADPLHIATTLRDALTATLRPLRSVEPGALVARRRARFRAFGAGHPPLPGVDQELDQRSGPPNGPLEGNRPESLDNSRPEERSGE